MKRTTLTVTKADRHLPEGVNRTPEGWLENRPDELFDVAATALERGCAVATFNQHHFAGVPGLQVIIPE